MSVHDLFTRREKAPTVTKITKEGHLLWVLMEAQRAFDGGDFQKGLTNLTHAVFVAATDGRGQLSETDLIHELRKISGFDFDGSAA